MFKVGDRVVIIECGEIATITHVLAYDTYYVKPDRTSEEFKDEIVGNFIPYLEREEDELKLYMESSQENEDLWDEASE